MNSNTVELEGLVVGPYLWSAAKCYQFCNNAFNLFSKKDVQFEKELNAGSDQVLGTSNFVDMLGIDYWNILKLSEKRKDQYNLDGENDVSAAEKKKSVIMLLKLIRDKIAHIRDYKDNVKEKLNQITTNGRRFQFFYRNKKGLYQLDENQFVAFWIFKFPKLMPYLWLKFYQFEKELAIYKYYPDNKIKISDFQDTYLDLNRYEKELRTALKCDMENGNIFKRFTGPGCCSLEFRGFHNLEAIRDSNKCIALAVNSKVDVVLSVSHSCTSMDTVEYIEATPGTDKLILVFASDITDEKVWKICNNYDCRIIVFCDPKNLTTEKVEEGVNKFTYGEELTKYLVMGSELSQAKQGWVFEHGQVVVQGMDMRIKDIFSNISTMSGILTGNLLSKMLKNEKPTILGNYMYPEYKGVYIERNLLFNQNASDVRLECIYVAVNYSIKELSYYGDTQIFNNIEHLEEEIDSVQSDCKFILLKEHEEISNEIREKSDAALWPKIVRFLDKYYYLRKPTNSRICDCLELEKEIFCISETDFLKMIGHKNIKTILFRAESGMGKSKLLISLGKQIENVIVVFCAFRKFVDILQKNVGATECNKTNVKCVIVEILGCEDECEKNVIDSWLDRKGGAGTKLELQLDGLDEVPSKHFKLAMKTLKIIESYFDSVRLWITSTRPFPREMERIKLVELNISPFQLVDKIEFFVQSWAGKNTKEPIEFRSARIKIFLHYISKLTFLNSITTKQNELTDYPLFCNMLAELYEDDYTERSLLSLSLNQIDLYKSLTNKKFASMIKQKIGKEPEENDNDFELLKESYMHVHKYFALVHLFPEVPIQFTRPSAMKFLSEQNMFKMRIITNVEPPGFVHRSYAHFFAALFVMNGIKTGELGNLCSKETFDNFVLSGTLDKSNLKSIILLWEIVNSYLSDVMDWRSLKWLESQNRETICYTQYNRLFLYYAIRNSLWALTRLLLNVQKSKIDSMECSEILYNAILQKAPTNWCIEMCEKLSFNNPNNLLICSVQTGKYEIAKYLIDTWCGNKVFDEIAEVRGDRGGIFHFIVDMIAEPDFKLTQISFVEETKEFIMFVHEKNPDEIKRRDNRGRNLLLALPLLQTRFSSISAEEIFLLKKFVIEDLNEDVNQLSVDGESVLCLGMFSVQDSKHIGFSAVRDAMIYHKTLAFVASKNFAHINLKSKKSGLTPLGDAVQYFGKNLRKETIEIFQDLGADFNELNYDGNTILHYCAENCDDIEFIKMLVEHGSQIDIQNRKGICALCFAEKEGKVELVTFFREQLGLRKDESCELNCIIITECE